MGFRVQGLGLDVGIRDCEGLRAQRGVGFKDYMYCLGVRAEVLRVRVC